eukprot:13209203-Alexandrium_andersonii.AAC.1
MQPGDDPGGPSLPVLSNRRATQATLTDGAVRVIDDDWRYKGNSRLVEGEWTGATTSYEGPVSVPLPDDAPPTPVEGGLDADGQGS